MAFKRSLILTGAIIALLTWHHSPVRAQQPSPQAAGVQAKNQDFFPLEEVRAGLKGVSRTVFTGSEPEEFGVEVLGVLPGFPAPRQSAIIARLTGANVEKTGVFGGMSGSPVYIDNRLVGAIAFAFPFSKEPIAGITPIKQMIDIFARAEKPAVKAVSGPSFRPVTAGQLSGAEWKPALPKLNATNSQMLLPVANAPQLAAYLGQQLTPIATPVVFGGISAEALAQFAPDLQANGLLPVSGVGGAAAITPLAKADAKTLLPGTSVSVQLIRGDFSVAAAGTVTYRDAQRIYAFGHPFLSLGAADMPMTEASVVSVIPNTANSFKLSVPGRLVGAFSQDRSTGIFGELGQAPTMIPVRVNLRTSRDQNETYHYEVANDRFLTPLLLNMTLFSTITAVERGVGESTITVDGKISLDGEADILLERRFSANRAAAMASASVAAPVAALLTSGFENVKLKGVELNITASDVKSEATLERIALDKTEVKRGETVEAQAFIRTESGRQFVQRIPVTVPSDVPPGQLLLFVGDGAALQQGMSPAQAIVPQNLTQLVETINKIKKADRLYVKLFQITPGAVIGNDEMPNLPPSMVATLNSERSSGGYTPTPVSPIYEKELPAAEFVIQGQQLIGLTVTQ